MSKDLILEIGSEELPAGFIPKTLESMTRVLKKHIEDARLKFDEIKTLGTPRRLTFIVKGLDERQSDATVEVRGPQVKAAFDADGKPTKALEGFARGQGVSLDDIETVKTEKGEYVYASKHILGIDTIKILPEILTKTLSQDYFPKAMRWGGHDITYARPVHWILCLFGGEAVAFDYGHIRSGSVTYGHRFTKGSEGPRPESIEVTGVEAYLEGLRAHGVIADPEERKRIIVEGLEAAAKEAEGVVLPDPGLLDEVACLVEYPVVVLGSFEPGFLELPRQVVINAMREHQRYFSIVDKNEALLPNFLTVANTEAKDMAVVRRGNERVLRARLNDAKFYYEKDVKTPLTEWAGKLKGVVFQAKLGTSYEKVMRFTELALFLGERTRFSAPADKDEGPEDFLTESMNPSEFDPGKVDPGFYSRLVVGRSAVLSKADLVTGMVGEFPTLQGIMGSVYAKKGGECEPVASAIYEHYLPTQSGGDLPASIPGAIVSMADKLDTICGCFGIGLVPSGAADPYALRRQSLGIISIILDKGFHVPLDEMVEKAVGILGEKLTRDASEVQDSVLDFFKERLRHMLLGQNLSFDSIDAVLSAPWFDLSDAVKRIRALEGFKAHPACTSLVTAFKRVSNILKGVEPKDLRPDPGLFTDPQEKALSETVARIAPVIDAHLSAGEYEKLFTALASIKDDIDAFFDKTMVMVDDEKIRNNRLVLLNTVRNLYFRTADLSRLAV